MDKKPLTRKGKVHSHIEAEQYDSVKDFSAPKKIKLDTKTIMEYTPPQRKSSDPDMLTQSEIRKQLGEWGGRWARSSETVELTREQVYDREIRKFKENTTKQFEKFKQIRRDIGLLEQDIDQFFQSIIPNAIKDVKPEEVKKSLEDYLAYIKKQSFDAKERRDDNNDIEDVKNYIKEIKSININNDLAKYIDLNKDLEGKKAEHLQKQIESYIQYGKEQESILEYLVEMKKMLYIEETVRNKEEDIQDIHIIIQSTIEDSDTNEEISAIRGEFNAVQERLATAKERFKRHFDTQKTPVSNLQLFLDRKKAHTEYYDSQIEEERNLTTIEDKLDRIEDAESTQ